MHDNNDLLDGLRLFWACDLSEKQRREFAARKDVSQLPWPLEKLSAYELAPVSDKLAELARSGIADMNWKRRKTALESFRLFDDRQKIIISEKLAKRYQEFTRRKAFWNIKELDSLLEFNRNGLLDLLCELME